MVETLPVVAEAKEERAQKSEQSLNYVCEGQYSDLVDPVPNQLCDLTLLSDKQDGRGHSSSAGLVRAHRRRLFQTAGRADRSRIALACPLLSCVAGSSCNYLFDVGWGTPLLAYRSTYSDTSVISS